MKQLQKYITVLILLDVLLAAAGYLFLKYSDTFISFGNYIILLTLFSGIALITIVIFLLGQTKEPESQTLHTLVAIVLKLLLEMILALGWFFLSKNNSLSSVLLFFILYLSLTLFSVLVILKTLKNRSL